MNKSSQDLLAITSGEIEQHLKKDSSKLPPIPLSRENSGDSLKIQKYRYSPIQNPFKSGPTYTVGGVKHVLPKPQGLKPYMDTRSGTLDTWPAHTTGTSGTKQVALSRNKEFVVVDEEKLGKPQITPKPKFLETLENFLKKELRSLGISKVEANELRLQAHREVFDHLMESFPTYRPLLKAIKDEYEINLAHNRDYIRKLEPLKQVLVTTTELCEQRVETYKSGESVELANLKKETVRLQEVIEFYETEQQDLIEEVERLQLKLAEQYEDYREQADARKLLVIDINELRYRQEDLLLQQQAANQYQSGEDPTVMKIALRRAKKDLNAVETTLAELLEQFKDVTPRRDFELLQKKLEELSAAYEKKNRDTEQLKYDHESLNGVHQSVIQQKETFYTECERLRQTATPRPDWERCADVVPGGIQRWEELSQGLSSDQLVGVLLDELSRSAAGDVGAPEYFEGQGEEADVPAYLRFEGQVRNRHFGKKETATLIKDIWREKIKFDQEHQENGRSQMSNFLVHYLEERFPLKQMVIEWCYNIHDACQRFSHDERIAMFFGVLTDEIDEEVYHQQINQISLLLGHLTKSADAENPDQFTADMFKLTLTDYYEGKPDDDIDILARAAEQELSSPDNPDNNIIKYKNLFIEDEEGRFGPFIDEVKRQLEREKISYVNDIKKELQDVKQVTVEDLKRAVTTTDPEINAETLDAMLFWAFRVGDRDALETAPVVPVDEMEQRLINGNIKRSGGREDD